MIATLLLWLWVGTTRWFALMGWFIRLIDCVSAVCLCLLVSGSLGFVLGVLVG